MTVRSISINKDLEKQVVNHCNKTGRTFSGLIAFLLSKYLYEVENAR
jgi:hypothetical protein